MIYHTYTNANSSLSLDKLVVATDHEDIRAAVEAFGGNVVSSLADAKSSLADAESSLGDAKSSLGDAESSLGDAKSSLGDAESSLG